MKKTVFFQIVWLVFLSLACVLVINARRQESATAEPLLTTASPIPIRGEYDSEAGVMRVSIPTAVGSLSPVPRTPSPSPTATASPTPAPTATPQPTPFSLYWFSDTQVYAYKLPTVFSAMTGYMASHHTEDNALYALHTGDTVDNRNLSVHWDNAEKALKLLDGELRLLCVAGNHDVGADSADYTEWLRRGFLAVSNADQLYRGGVCFYEPFSAGGTDFLILGIGWQTDTDWLGFAKDVLERYENCCCILLVHSFLTDDGELTGTGKLIESELLQNYASIRLVLCGHNDGSTRWQGSYEDGAHRVNALMYNFQDDKKYGLGYLRILCFDPIDRSIRVTTYSPYLDDYNYYSGTEKSRDSFTLENAF